MYKTLIQYFYDYCMNDNNKGFRLLCSSVCIDILSGLYNKFIKNNEVPPIEELDEDTKAMYKSEALKRQSGNIKRIRAVAYFSMLLDVLKNVDPEKLTYNYVSEIIDRVFNESELES